MSATDIQMMIREHSAQLIVEKDERIADLEGERDTYRFWWQQTLHALADITTKYGRRHEDYQRLQDEVRDLRAMVVTGYYEDAIAVIGPETFAAVRSSLPDSGSERHPPAGIQ